MCGIDIANQINNPWTKDSFMALVSADLKYAIVIPSAIKKKIKRKFFDNDRMHNHKVIAIMHAYLIFKCLIANKAKIKKVIICNDCPPYLLVYKYLLKIASHCGWKTLTEDVNITPRKNIKKDGKKLRKGQSKAHKYANKVRKGIFKADYVINTDDYETIRNVIRTKL